MNPQDVVAPGPHLMFRVPPPAWDLAEPRGASVSLEALVKGVICCPSRLKNGNFCILSFLKAEPFHLPLVKLPN